MIQMALLVALGFLAASLLAILFAGPFWRRAERLTEKRIAATMPISPGDIRADKDRLRAEYAVRLRRLEMAHEKERDNAARFLIERNRHRIEIGELNNRIAALEDRLEERGNENTVLEQTIRKRIPELEQQLERARQIIAARDRNLARMTTAYENQTEALAIAKKTAQRYSGEIERLRQALEKGEGRRRWRGGDAALAEENRKLQAELSRLRQEVERFRETDVADNALLKSEIHNLAERMMSGEAAPPAPAEKPVPERAAEGESGQSEAAESPEKETEEEKETAEAGAGDKPRQPARMGMRLTERLKKLGASSG